MSRTLVMLALLVLSVAGGAFAQVSAPAAPAPAAPDAAAPVMPAAPVAPESAVAPAAPIAPAAPVAPAVTPHITLLEIIALVVYLFITGYLGWLGWRRSKTAEEFLVAGRNAHPFVMALSYGATFISTSAIVGFGGFAGMVGMSLLWLTFLNIFVGIFIAFAVLGGPTRRLGHHLGAHTFPELLGKRYDSRFIQVFAGLVIFLFMPVYAAGVLLGGAKFLASHFGIEVNVAILIFAVIVALYVVAGGLKGVMYTDAFQGTFMFVGMIILLFFAYNAAGGWVSAHQALDGLSGLLSQKLKDGGVVSLSKMPIAGSPMWWTVVSSLVLGVGIGVLAQPQLSVRFMTVHSKRELNRACAVGGVFILAMTGIAFTVGALSNVYFHSTTQQLSITVAKGDLEQIIPSFIKAAMPKWFGVLFLLTLLSAALSTLSSQFHTMGTAFGRDIYEQGVRRKIVADKWTRLVTQLGIMIAIVVTVTLCWKYSKSLAGVIAKSTALFFALCASSFLPSLFLGLFWKRMTRAAAIASMVGAFFFAAFWLLFVQADTSKAVGLLAWLKGVDVAADPKWVSSLIPSHPWSVIDSLVFALPLSFIVAVVVALLTKPMPAEHIRKCFPGRSA